ncbi:uncharacterized protein LOC130710155 [Lotus japonicus]|uniref:Uncharacterized protein n=1 Tax=Lotus japonicus TaxID=34305 RepID=I3SRS5_LOTJA|nr:uncharacterized protein LOC130710155 [Lotus japonicus]AFK42967.1 unknown [Lotus japonicus]
MSAITVIGAFRYRCYFGPEVALLGMFIRIVTDWVGEGIASNDGPVFILYFAIHASWIYMLFLELKVAMLYTTGRYLTTDL